MAAARREKLRWDVQRGLRMARVLSWVAWIGVVIVLCSIGAELAFAADLLPNSSLDLSPQSPSSSTRPVAIGCAQADPASVPGKSAAPVLDRPLCATLTVPASRDLLRLTRSDVAVSLGVVGGDQQSFGLMRALASFSHLLDLGPFAGWVVHGEAQVTGQPLLGGTPPVAERAIFSASPQSFAAWGLRFDAGVALSGVFDPLVAARTFDVAANASRHFVVPGWTGDHQVNLRLAHDNVTSTMSGAETQTMRATFGYAHSLSLGSIGADFAYERSTAPDTPIQDSSVMTIKFARPF